MLQQFDENIKDEAFYENSGGAVTHVLIDDPTKGYRIFAENMLETAQSVAEEQQMKDAS